MISNTIHRELGLKFQLSRRYKARQRPSLAALHPLCAPATAGTALHPAAAAITLSPVLPPPPPPVPPPLPPPTCLLIATPTLYPTVPPPPPPPLPTFWPY
ncbi:hypothetical protein PUN28_012628 [Cardiocondyla obscurior]|uniref:Uncharacterized protein n=1 Tax=Cardiocondyla obscurior TaxID=286306 RepID=A0AAW2FED3_9HYME